MKSFPIYILTVLLPASGVSADIPDHFQALYTEDSVETRRLFIKLGSVDDDVRFSVTLEDRETGLKRRYEFDGQGASDPDPFLVAHRYYCDTSVILLTVEYPWRHDLPQYVQVLDTFAFRASDLEFIDVTFGPMTDIALADDTAYEPSETDMLPPIRVRCLVGNDEKPFEFFEPETK
jgi:hypothetical protein